MVQQKFKCPLCKSIRDVSGGHIDNGGGNSLPYASCKCGFRFHPEVRLAGAVGESGWDHIAREFEEARKIIAEKLPVGTEPKTGRQMIRTSDESDL